MPAVNVWRGTQGVDNHSVGEWETVNLSYLSECEDGIEIAKPSEIVHTILVIRTSEP